MSLHHVRRGIVGAVLFLAFSIAGCARDKQPAPGATPSKPAVSAPAPVPAPASASSAARSRSPRQPKYTLERVGQKFAPVPQQPFELPADGLILVSGWAVDDAASRAASGVEIVLDGKPMGARYGQERPDVAKHFAVPAYTNSGFDLTLEARQLAPGPHSLAIRVLAQDGKSYYEGPTFKMLKK